MSNSSSKIHWKWIKNWSFWHRLIWFHFFQLVKILYCEKTLHLKLFCLFVVKLKGNAWKISHFTTRLIQFYFFQFLKIFYCEKTLHLKLFCLFDVKFMGNVWKISHFDTRLIRFSFFQFIKIAKWKKNIQNCEKNYL